MKKSILYLCMLLSLSIHTLAQIATPPSGGDGSSGNPYQIATLENLYWIRFSGEWDKYYIQTADIDASATSSWNSGAGWEPIGITNQEFTGQYDGNNKTISGLTLNRAAQSAQGLFSVVEGGTFKNLGLTNVNITAYNSSGALVALGTNITVQNCYSTGTISLNSGSSGGLVCGVDNNGSGSLIENSYSSITINSGNSGTFGGIIGYTTDDGTTTTIRNCYFDGTINANSNWVVGGIIGDSRSTGDLFEYCYNAGTISGSGGNYGGIAGFFSSTGKISNCYNVGSISGSLENGGIIGATFTNPIIEYCYNAGTVVVGTSCGGILGTKYGGSPFPTITSCFYDNTINSDPTLNNGYGDPKSTGQMKTTSTYTSSGWNFTTIWTINGSNNSGYPYLQWQFPSTVITWDGSIDTDWNDVTNWSAGYVPTSTDDVNIPNVTNNPIIDKYNSSLPATCNSITIEAGASLTISENNALTTSGDFINNGTFTINSSASGTGSIIIAGSVSGSGTSNFNRFIDDWNTGDGWHFLSSPVSSQSIQTEFVPNPPTSSEDFYSWDEVNDMWINSESGSGVWNPGFESTFTVGKGYLVAYSTDQTKTFSGTINNADVSKTGLTYTQGSTFYGANFLGNPYPCALQWNQTSGSSGWNLSNIDGTAKIWNSANSSYSDVSQGEIIPAMQGFMVLVSSTGTGSLNIHKGDRTHSSTSWYKSSESTKIKIVVHDIAGGTAQESILIAKDDATEDFDHAYDSPFFEGYAPKFYSKIDNIPVSSNAIAEFNEETIIPYSFCKNSSTDFYIELESAVNLAEELEVHIYDNVTGICHNLSETSKYYFSSSYETVTERFVVAFTDITSVDQYSKRDMIKIYRHNNNVHILNPNRFKGEVAIYNLHGQLIHIAKTNNEAKIEIELAVPGGYYIVKFSNSEMQKVKKVWLD